MTYTVIAHWIEERTYTVTAPNADKAEEIVQDWGGDHPNVVTETESTRDFEVVDCYVKEETS